MKLSEIQAAEETPAPTSGGGLKLSQVTGSAPADAEKPWYERAWTAMKGEHEDFPELPYSAQRKLEAANINPLRARTFDGQFNLIKQVYPNAQVVRQDKFGNPLITLGEPSDKTIMGFGTGDVYAPDQLYYLNKPGVSVMDATAGGGAMVERIAPAVAASAVLGPAGLALAAPAVGVTATATEAAAQAVSEKQGAREGFSGSDMARAGVYAMLGEGTGRAISKTIEIFSKQMGPQFAERVVSASGEITDDAVIALRNAGIDPRLFSRALADAANKTGLSPQQALKAAAAESVGVKLTTGQRTGEVPQLRAEEIARQSTNPSVRQPLVERDIANNRALSNYASEIQTGTGGAADPLTTGATIKQALRGRETGEKAAATSIYTKARDTAGAETPFPPEVRNQFFEKVVPVLDDFEGKIPTAVQKRLEQFGVFGKGTRDFNFGEGERFRQLLNEYASEIGPTATAVGKLKRAYDEAVQLVEGQSSAAGEMFKAGRAAVAARKDVFNQSDVVEAIVSRKARFTDVIPDERVVDKLVFTGSVSDLAKAKNALLTGTPEQIAQGSQAFNDLRATTFRRLVDDAMQNNARNEAGEAIFSGARFNNALRKIGDEKLRVLFSPAEIEKIHALKLTADAMTNLPRGAVNTSYTATFLKEMQRATDGIPFVKYLVDKLDLANRGIVKRALAEGALTEAQRRMIMNSRVLPKAGTAIGMEAAQE